jgi:hypothetical protein
MVSPEDPHDGSDQPARAFVTAVAEQVRTMDGRERATGTDVSVGDLAIIEPDRD